MSRRSEEDDRFYDLVYDAWRSGRDSDAVSRDRFDYRLSQGYCPDEIRLRDVLPPKTASTNNQEPPPPTIQRER